MIIEKHKTAIIGFNQIDLGDRARKEYREIGVLANSIREKGLIQPLCVMEQEGEKPFLLLAGGRRFHALQMLDWKEVPVNIYPFLKDERDRRAVELVENIQRQDLTYAEEVALKKSIHDHMIETKGQKTSFKDKDKWSLRSTAELLGTSVGNLSNDIELANVMQELPDLAKCKNKAEAKKRYAKMKESLIQKELARRAEQKVSSNEIDQNIRTLIESYVIGDTFEALKNVQDGIFNLVEIDPPYAITLKKTLANLSDQEKQHLMSNEDISPEEYKEYLVKLYSLCFQKMKMNSWLITWFAMHPWMPVVIEALRESGLEPMLPPSVWVRKTGSVRTPDIHLPTDYEPFIYARKGKAVIQRQRSGVFEHPPIHGSKKAHPTEKPIQLYQEILRTFCPENSRVLSAFAGSGNFLLAAANNRFECLGIDISEEYRASFITKATTTQYGFYHSEGTIVP